MAPKRRLAASAAAIFALTIIAPDRAHAQSAVIGHGQHLTAKMVGPRAAGYAAGHLHVSQSAASAVHTGLTIRDDTVAPFLQRIATGATYDGFAIPGPHLLIEGVAFTGALDVYAELPLVLRGVSVRIAGASYWGVLSRQGAGQLYFMWSEAGGVVPDTGKPGARQAGVQRGLYFESDNAVVYRSHISHAADGIQVHAPGARVIETLIEDLTTWEGEHNDGIQLIGKGERLTIQRSRIVNPNPQTSCVLLQRGGHVIEDSYLSGGGWVIYGAATPKPPDILPARDLRITGNVFGQEFSPKSGTFGPIADWDGAEATGNIWRNNRFANGLPVEPVQKVGR